MASAVLQFSSLVTVLVFLLQSTQIAPAQALLEGIYCGLENCYDVLGINRDDINLKEMSRAYRKLARKWHPDMHQGEEAKQEATIKFRLVATAYEVLRDEESRKDYDYMLDNPEEMYAHYYRYYRRMYAPKVDVRIVILVVITLISAYQYYASHSKYKEAIDYFVTVPKYRMKAQEIATDEGIWPNPTQTSEGKSRVKLRGPNKSKLKDIVRGEEEAVIRKVIEEKMDIKGSYEKPTWRDLLWAQIFLLPVVLYNFIYFHVRWLYKFTINNHELGLEEKHYLIRKYMGMSELDWHRLEPSEIDHFMREELWIKENFVPWKVERDAEAKAKLAESGQYKRYRRYLKKGGAGQITFLDD